MLKIFMTLVCLGMVNLFAFANLSGGEEIKNSNILLNIKSGCLEKYIQEDNLCFLEFNINGINAYIVQKIRIYDGLNLCFGDGCGDENINSLYVIDENKIRVHYKETNFKYLTFIKALFSVQPKNIRIYNKEYNYYKPIDVTYHKDTLDNTFKVIERNEIERLRLNEIEESKPINRLKNFLNSIISQIIY